MIKEFANDTFIPKEFLKLKNKYKINVAIETGTNLGATTKWLSENFNIVHTFELNNNVLNDAKNYCSDKTNIQYYLGSSSELLNNIIDDIKNENVIFFLDAHGGYPCPTIDELKVIKKMIKKPVICIHDFHVPGKNFGWDVYSDFEYRIENIEQYLIEIYGENKYSYYYNNKTNGYNRGIIYITPNI